MKLLTTTTALVLALAAPAFADNRGNGNNNGPQSSATAIAGASSSASVRSTNTNVNHNSATAVQGQHQSANNRNSINIEGDERNAPGFAVGAATPTAPCYVVAGASLSVIDSFFGGGGLSIPIKDQDCIRSLKIEQVRALLPGGVGDRVALRLLAQDPDLRPALVAEGVVVEAPQARPATASTRSTAPRSRDCAQVPAAFRGDLNC